jgi:DNA-binding transcriptional LysR family regulator
LNVLARECFASLLDFKGGCKGLPVEIVIGAGESIIDWVLMPHLGEVRKKLPNVRLKFLNLATSEVVRRLADGVIDFGVVRKDAVARPLQSVLLGVMGYSLFVPEGLRGGGTGAKALEAPPLATLEGEGTFRKELSAIARKNRLELKIEVECASFPLVARAVGTGGVAAVLPSVAGVELARLGARELKIAVLDSLRRDICLAWNPRLLRIRTALDNANKVFTQAFRI